MTCDPEPAPAVIQDDQNFAVASEPSGTASLNNTVVLNGLEGGVHFAERGDIVIVLSPSGGCTGTMAYVKAFTKTGRVKVCTSK